MRGTAINHILSADSEKTLINRYDKVTHAITWELPYQFLLIFVSQFLGLHTYK